MLCTRCQKNEATVHITAVMNAEEESLHLCKECAPAGFANLDLEKAREISVLGKKCEFCGGDARSGQTFASGEAIYCCVDCGMELTSIVVGLLETERPDLMRRIGGADSFLSVFGDADFLEGSKAIHQKAIEKLKVLRRADGRDKER
jgi:hypothetical protein